MKQKLEQTAEENAIMVEDSDVMGFGEGLVKNTLPSLKIGESLKFRHKIFAMTSNIAMQTILKLSWRTYGLNYRHELNGPENYYAITRLK